MNAPTPVHAWLDGHCASFTAISFALLQFASHMVVPIHKCSLRIVAPCPYMQLKEWIQVEAVRSTYELEILAIQ
jgi:hypothetical protein